MAGPAADASDVIYSVLPSRYAFADIREERWTPTCGGRRSPIRCGGARRGFPDRLGLACGKTRWTYRDLHAVSERLAAGLAARGIGRGDKVAVLARNSHGFVALRYALMRLGAILVPINFMLQPDDVAFILNHSGARMLASDSGMAEVARKGAALAPHVSEFLWLPSEEESAPPEGMTNFYALIETGGEPPGAGPESFDVAQIVYTSGTESRPKGVQLTHDAILWQYVSCMVDAEISGDDVAVHALPLYHCAQLDVFLGPSIYAGGVNIVTAKPVPDNIFSLIERERATSFFAPPTVWISMLRSPAFDGADLGACARAITAPRSCRSRSCAKWRAACRTSAYGTSTARPRSPRSPPCSGPTISCASRARAAGRCSTSRRGWSTTGCAT